MIKICMLCTYEHQEKPDKVHREHCDECFNNDYKYFIYKHKNKIKKLKQELASCYTSIFEMNGQGCELQNKNNLLNEENKKLKIENTELVKQLQLMRYNNNCYDLISSNENMEIDIKNLEFQLENINNLYSTLFNRHSYFRNSIVALKLNIEKSNIENLLKQKLRMDCIDILEID